MSKQMFKSECLQSVRKAYKVDLEQLNDEENLSREENKEGVADDKNESINNNNIKYTHETSKIREESGRIDLDDKKIDNDGISNNFQEPRNTKLSQETKCCQVDEIEKEFTDTNIDSQTNAVSPCNDGPNKDAQNESSFTLYADNNSESKRTSDFNSKSEDCEGNGRFLKRSEECASSRTPLIAALVENIQLQRTNTRLRTCSSKLQTTFENYRLATEICSDAYQLEILRLQREIADTQRQISH